MNNQEELIKAKEKAINVIKSCKTYDHVINAISYVNLFYKKFEDRNSYEELIQLYKNKLIRLNYQNI